MSALTDVYEEELLDHWFLNEAIANFGDAAGLPASAGDGDFSIALHKTSAVTDTATSQDTNELAYTGYSRQHVARGVAEWSVAGTSPTEATNDNVISFGEATAGTPETAVSVTIGNSLGSPEQVIMYGSVSLVINNNITPSFAAGALDITAA